MSNKLIISIDPKDIELVLDAIACMVHTHDYEFKYAIDRHDPDMADHHGQRAEEFKRVGRIFNEAA